MKDDNYDTILNNLRSKYIKKKKKKKKSCIYNICGKMEQYWADNFVSINECKNIIAKQRQNSNKFIIYSESDIRNIFSTKLSPYLKKKQDLISLYNYYMSLFNLKYCKVIVGGDTEPPRWPLMGDKFWSDTLFDIQTRMVDVDGNGYYDGADDEVDIEGFWENIIVMQMQI